MTAPADTGVFARPYVISWNLTYRCNLRCEHCYLDAGAKKEWKVNSPAFADRGELSTQKCLEVFDEIALFAPEALVILTGGEPLLRPDILDLIARGSERKLWTVAGTNGVLITASLARLLKEKGLRGLALSLDALDPATHDRFRRVEGAWNNTVEGARILNGEGLPFIVQTTVGRHNHRDIARIAEFACKSMEARVFNLYFLVPSGRGQYVTDLEPAEYEVVLAELMEIQKRYEGRMVVNAKCAPHFSRYLFEREPASKFLKSFRGGAGGCPAGTQYLGIRPNGDVTPCPYLPLFGGNLQSAGLKDIWEGSDLFRRIRARNELGGRCGNCEFSGRCGGCRARAYSALGDVMAEDPLCHYEPGQHARADIEARFAENYGFAAAAVASHGNGAPPAPEADLAWDSNAEERLLRIPAFVRGYVRKRVEEHCRRNAIPRVTEQVMAEIRARLPASGIFTRKPG